MGSKKTENKMACVLFEALRKYPKEKRKQFLNGVVEKVVKEHPEKPEKFNIERIKSEAFRLLKEYDGKISERERKELEKKFEEYRDAVEKSIYQWRMGIYRDLTHKNVLSYVDSMEFYLLRLAQNLNYELNEKSKTYIVPYPDNILDVIYDIREQFYYDYRYGIRQKIDYNNVLKQIKGLYDAIEILIGKKPEVKVIKEVKEVVKIVKEKPKPNKEHWIRAYERTLDLYMKEYNQFKNSMKCSNCGNKPIGYICEKCGWDNSNQYADGSELRKKATKFIENSLDIVTKIMLLDEECGLKWISRYQMLVDKLAVKKSDIDIEVD